MIYFFARDLARAEAGEEAELTCCGGACSTATTGRSPGTSERLSGAPVRVIATESRSTLNMATERSLKL